MREAEKSNGEKTNNTFLLPVLWPKEEEKVRNEGLLRILHQ